MHQSIPLLITRPQQFSQIKLSAKSTKKPEKLVIVYICVIWLNNVKIYICTVFTPLISTFTRVYNLQRCVVWPSHRTIFSRDTHTVRLMDLNLCFLLLIVWIAHKYKSLLFVFKFNFSWDMTANPRIKVDMRVLSKWTLFMYNANFLYFVV